MEKTKHSPTSQEWAAYEYGYCRACLDHGHPYIWIDRKRGDSVGIRVELTDTLMEEFFPGRIDLLAQTLAKILFRRYAGLKQKETENTNPLKSPGNGTA